MKRSRPIIAFCSALALANVATANEEISSYIYNGQVTTTMTWPSYAAVYYDATTITGMYGQYCGASILDEDHVMLAAHCVTNGDGGLNYGYLVYTSILPQLSNKSQFLSGTVENIRAKKVFVHPGYVDSPSEAEVPWPNDIAIIELESAMNIDSTAYAKRAQSYQVDSYRIDSEPFVAIGMGLTENDTSASQLLWTTLEYEPEALCDLGAGDSQICTSGRYNTSTEVRNASCSGDSGGPLYWYDNSTYEYYQIGVTSYGWDDCSEASSDDTSVFTEVADYNTWIESVLNGNENPDLVITDDLRLTYGAIFTDPISIHNSYRSDNDNSSDSSSYQANSDTSAGSSGIGVLGLLAVLGLKRRKLSRVKNQ